MKICANCRQPEPAHIDWHDRNFCPPPFGNRDKEFKEMEQGDFIKFAKKLMEAEPEPRPVAGASEEKK